MTEIAYSHIRACSLICVRLFATLWTAAYQAPLSVGFSRQEYWSGLLLPPPGDLPHPGTEPISLYISCIGRQILYCWATWEARARARTHTHRQIKPFRNLITLLYIYYFIMVDCKGKWFYVKAKFFPKKLNIILTVYVFIFYICVYFLIFLRKAFTGQHWC